MAEERREGDVPGGGAGEGAEDALSRIQSLVEELESARASARKARVWITLLIVVALLGFVGGLCGLIATFDRDALVAHVQVNMGRTFQEMGPRLLKGVESVSPEYQEAFRAELQEVGPKIAKRVEPELDKLMIAVRRQSEEILTKRMESMTKGHEALIRQTFPTLRDERNVTRVIENLQNGLMNALGEVATDRLAKCVDAMERVHKITMEFLPPERKEEHRRLKERMADIWDDFIYPQIGEGATAKELAK